MKRKIVMMAAMVLSIGCMAVPVGACENVADPAGVAVEASVTSPGCPTCGVIGEYKGQVITDSYTMIMRKCSDHGDYTYFEWH